MTVLNQDYREMLQILLENKVKFLVVGGYAVGAHGYPRATGDIDIWVEASENNSRAVYRSLATFGAPVGEINETTFIKKGVAFQIGVAPRRIDIITKISGVEFEEAYPQRKMIEVDDLALPFISYGDLIKNKKATGRDRDRLDANRLERGRP
jgi:hypothetical protein